MQLRQYAFLASVVWGPAAFGDQVATTAPSMIRTTSGVAGSPTLRLASAVPGASALPRPAVQMTPAPVAESPLGIGARKPPGWQPPPANTAEWADRCTDFTVNGWGFKDPANFTRLVDRFSDPAIYLEFARRALDPESYARMAGTLMDPATAANYLQWTDPVIYEKWAAAALDPRFYTAAMAPLLQPEKYLRWMTLPLNPQLWSVMFSTMNPAVWGKWAFAPLNPRVYEPLAGAADPATTPRWGQALAAPRNYGVPAPSVPANPLDPRTGQLAPGNGASAGEPTATGNTGPR